jgi:hypothetical protein
MTLLVTYLFGLFVRELNRREPGRRRRNPLALLATRALSWCLLEGSTDPRLFDKAGRAGKRSGGETAVRPPVE